MIESHMFRIHSEFACYVCQSANPFGRDMWLFGFALPRRHAHNVLTWNCEESLNDQHAVSAQETHLTKLLYVEVQCELSVV